jgi:uncharacterized protein YndB with AHSA1/START domain
LKAFTKHAYPRFNRHRRWTAIAANSLAVARLRKPGRGPTIALMAECLRPLAPDLTPTGRPRRRAPGWYDGPMSNTHLTLHLKASRQAVYRALIDAQAVATWMVPTGMTSHVHRFEGREGGAFRISLTYESPTRTGKTEAQTDTYHGRFVELVPGERVVQALEFETANPAMQGEMTITYELADADGGTALTAVHKDLPPGISPADNELGWRISLGKLAAYVEGQ